MKEVQEKEKQKKHNLGQSGTWVVVIIGYAMTITFLPKVSK